MTCNDAAEYVSALSDREVIPPPAAEHIGACGTCYARLQEYLAMGAEMRRVASLDSTDQMPVLNWSSERRAAPSWWTKGWESMRIPRFAFALLLMTIVVLGSSLVMVKARAHTEGTVLMLTANSPGAESLRCALSLVDKSKDSCEQLSPPQNLLGIRVLSHTGEQIELGIREQYNPVPVGAGSYTASLTDLQKIPEKSYWFRPGEKLEVDVPGTTPLVLTGELTDHIPPFAGWADGKIDPQVGELRVTSPLLLRGNKVVHDFEGATAVQKDRFVVQMYIPSQGLWVLSLHPLPGAVEARVDLSRVKFEMNGQAYMFLMATPVTRNDHMWVMHDPNYRPSDPNLQNGFIGGADPDHLANSQS